MFEMGAGELLVVCLVGLFVLGPERLPAVAKRLGRLVHEVRRAFLTPDDTKIDSRDDVSQQ